MTFGGGQLLLSQNTYYQDKKMTSLDVVTNVFDRENPHYIQLLEYEVAMFIV